MTRRAPGAAAGGAWAIVGAAVACSAAFPSEAPWQAVPRIVLATGAVLVLPGWLLIRALRIFEQADVPFERGVVAFGLGYVLVTGVCIAVTLIELNLWWGVTLLGALCAGLFVAGRPGPERATTSRLVVRAPWSFESFVVAALALALFAFAWLVEPRMGGEESFELIVLRKILQNAAVTLENTLHRPNAVFPYVFAPHYFAMALVSKLSGLSLYVVYVKLRAVYAMVALAAFWALARRLTRSRAAGLFAVVALMLLILVDPDPWFWPASLFPLLRRGGFAMGVLFPVFALSVLLAVAPGEGRRWRARAWPALVLLAMLFTHAMSATLAMFLLAGLAVASFTVPIWREYRRAYVVLAGAALAVCLVYAALSNALVSHLTDYLQEDRAELVTLVRELAADPARGLFGGVPSGGRYLIAVSGAVTAYSMFPILWLPLLLCRAPSLGRWLWAPIVLPLALYATELGLAALQLATVKGAIFAGGYFSPLGLIVFTTSMFLVVRPLDGWLERTQGRAWTWRAGRLVVVCGVAIAVSRFVLLPLCWWCMARIAERPSLPLLVAGLGGLVVMAWRRVPQADPSDCGELEHRGALLAVWIGLLVPVFIGMKQFPGAISGSHRASAYTQYLETRNLPRVTEWRAYYPVFQQWTTVDMPWHVVRDLEGVIPPERVLVYDPRHSMTIPILLNDYIVNPGNVFSTDMQYFRDYVRKSADDVDVHPVFNDNPALDDKEREFLSKYGVEYVVANPDYRDVVESKMGALAGARRIYDREGFAVYRLPPHAAGSAR